MLQTYFHLPFKVPLLAPIDQRLKDITKRNIKRGGTPFDTALNYYAEMGHRAVGDGQNLREINFPIVFGSLWALREKVRFYSEHVRDLTDLGKSQGNDKEFK